MEKQRKLIHVMGFWQQCIHIGVKLNMWDWIECVASISNLHKPKWFYELSNEIPQQTIT